MSTFYMEIIFKDKKRFSHFIFYDIYFNNRRIYEKSFYNKNFYIRDGHKEYKNIKVEHINYEKIISNSINKIQKGLFNYTYFKNKKYYNYNKGNFFYEKSINKDYIYNYNNNFKGYVERNIFNNLYKKIDKSYYVERLLEENIQKNLNGYKSFYNKNIKNTFIYEILNSEKVRLENQNVLVYEKIINKLEKRIEDIIIYKKYKEIDFDKIYEKIKEKIFDEIFIMSGGIYQ